MTLPEGIRKADLIYVGKGAQGRVYLINKSQCIKIYKKPEYRERELACLQQAENDRRFPKIYQWGKNYIIRDYIPGIELGKYLQKHPLTESISRQLIDLLLAFKQLQYTRLDLKLRHVMISAKGTLRPIDFVNSMRIVKSYPETLFKELAKMGKKEVFLKHVKKLNQALYHEWQKQI